MNIEEIKFLTDIHNKGTTPEMVGKVIRAAISGMEDYSAAVRAHAVDMEVVASMALNTRLFKGNENFIADKLEKWKHMNGLRWDDQIERLRK